MKQVLIKYRSPTRDPKESFMPLFLYTEFLDVIKETEQTVTVRYDCSEFYTYEFDKKYIELYR
ncbi:MAG: hypothetical protein HFF36_02625 [Coprobacillus sp.]|nr:hypothetical protein [Coprobacillus sp.]